MQKMRLIALAGIVAGLAAGCGGNDRSGGPEGTVLAATTGAVPVKATRWASVRGSRCTR